MKTLIYIAAAAVLAAVVFVAWPHPAEQAAGAASKAIDQVPVDVVSPVRGEEPVAVSPPVAPQHELNGISKLSQLAALAEKDSPQKGQVLAELRLAIQWCELAALRRKHPSLREQEQMRTPEGKARLRYHHDFAGQFCDAQTVTQEMAEEKLVELGPDNPVVQAAALFGLDATEGNAVGLAIAERLANDRLHPAAVERASEYLLSHGRELPAMAKVPPPPSLKSTEARAEAQQLAVKMFTCASRGGCGQAGLYSSLWCQDCWGGKSLEDQWRRQYSPEVLEYARAVSRSIGR